MVSELGIRVKYVLVTDSNKYTSM